jgi:predicted metal-dependent phosphotriesterase family hydrolase
MCDFIGAGHTGTFRWNVDEVVATMLPYLKQARERGITGFVDCTPAYIGRDARVLRLLASQAEIHLVTNTGYYGAAGDRYLPKHAFTESPGQLADRWVREWERGIDGSRVRPGFIKIGVDPATGDPPRLSAVDEKLVRAAARAHRRTGLTVASHTAQGAAALEQIRVFAEEGADPARLIIVHADAEKDTAWHFRMAGKRAWVEYDGIGGKPLDWHLRIVPPMLEKHPDRLLLSMDAGWYNVGEPRGGKIRDYNFLVDRFLPALRKSGVGEAMIRRLTVENPAKAFAVTA